MLLIVFINIRPWLLHGKYATPLKSSPVQSQIWLSVMISKPLWIFQRLFCFLPLCHLCFWLLTLHDFRRFLVMISLLFVSFLCVYVCMICSSLCFHKKMSYIEFKAFFCMNKCVDIVIVMIAWFLPCTTSPLVCLNCKHVIFLINLMMFYKTLCQGSLYCSCSAIPERE